MDNYQCPACGWTGPDGHLHRCVPVTQGIDALQEENRRLRAIADAAKRLLHVCDAIGRFESGVVHAGQDEGEVKACEAKNDLRDALVALETEQKSTLDNRKESPDEENPTT